MKPPSGPERAPNITANRPSALARGVRARRHGTRGPRRRGRGRARRRDARARCRRRTWSTRRLGARRRDVRRPCASGRRDWRTPTRWARGRSVRPKREFRRSTNAGESAGRLLALAEVGDSVLARARPGEEVAAVQDEEGDGGHGKHDGIREVEAAGAGARGRAGRREQGASSAGIATTTEKEARAGRVLRGGRSPTRAPLDRPRNGLGRARRTGETCAPSVARVSSRSAAPGCCACASAPRSDDVSSTKAREGACPYGQTVSTSTLGCCNVVKTKVCCLRREKQRCPPVDSSDSAALVSPVSR